MSSERVAISFEAVSKRYRAGRSRTFVDLVASAVDRARNRDATVYSAARGVTGGDIWALRDATFEVPEGAGLGIIGRNGAGKTTVLKLVSRVTWPTSGRVRVAGRVVSLIELGAGFHPELTGRENVYLGGGLFGLTRRDVDRSFDRIVEFAGVERLIDTPMKRYSSGLYARLGFSVAVHSDPDIVLVDEVLAVGDAAFRRRALDRLQELIAGGRTVLFISHDIWHVRRLCRDILWMEDGRVRALGPAAAIAEEYTSAVNVEAVSNQAALQPSRRGTGEVRFLAIEIVDAGGRPTSLLARGDLLTVRATYRVNAPVDGAVFQVAIIDVETGIVVTTAASEAIDATVGADRAFDCSFPRLSLRPRQYALRVSITDARQLAAYDTVLAGPRFAVTGQGEDEDG